MSGRPIRFFAGALAGWVAVRAVMLWPVASPEALPHLLVPAAFADDAPRSRAPSTTATVVTHSFLASHLSARHSILSVAAPPAGQPAMEEMPGATMPIVTALPPRSASPQTLLAPPPAIQIASPPPDRWSASAWFVLRGGRGIAPGLGGGQLGGSQAGLRVAYAIDAARRVAIVGRVAGPLRGRGLEAAIGLEWRPTKLPVRLVAEYRVSLDGGGSGPAAGVIAGTGPAPVALGFDLETYGQAGVIRRRRTEPFADGAARLSRPLIGLGRATVDLGLGGWGGAQRGSQRLDVGPSIGLRAPIAGQSVRLSLDWRQRIAGNARPGSGPVLVIGSDF